MSLPTIAIQICTYNRYSEIQKVVAALQRFINYPKDKVILYICDDSSPGDYIKKLKRLKIFKFWKTRFITTDKNSGWGANVNNGLRLIPEEYIFFTEDDYVLERPLDLRVGVGLLYIKPHIGMLRYRGSAGGHFVYHQFEAKLDVFGSELQGKDTLEWYEGSRTVPYRLTYLQFDGGSPQLYIYSHGPHLKHKSFHEYYGFYPEGKRLGETEESFAHTVKTTMRTKPNKSLGIAILPEWVPMHFDHIGVSFQHTEDDV